MSAPSLMVRDLVRFPIMPCSAKINDDKGFSLYNFFLEGPGSPGSSPAHPEVGVADRTGPPPSLYDVGKWV